MLAVGGTNLTLTAGNGIAASGAWNDTVYPVPYAATAGGGGGPSTFVSRPWWQPAQSFAPSGNRMVPDVAAFADESPGYAIVCSGGVQDCSRRGGQRHRVRRRHQRVTPLVAGMIALWSQQARAAGRPRRVRAAAALLALRADPVGLRTTSRSVATRVFGGSCCPARTGYDLASGLGSPFADEVAAQLD